MPDDPLPPFQWVFDQHASGVLGFLRREIGPVDADDCFQETMLSALRAYPRLTDASNLRGWLLTIARRKAIDAHRAATRRPVPVADPQPVGLTASADDGGDLWESVRELPEAQRAALEMRYASDRSYRDIAGALSISEAAARQRVHQGMKTLRRKVR